MPKGVTEVLAILWCFYWNKAWTVAKDSSIFHSHPGVAENIAPVGGPGSDITNEGLKLDNRGTIAGCKMVSNVRCKMGAYNMFTKIQSDFKWAQQI